MCIVSNTSLAAYCLQLPGKKLHLSALLTAKKFRGRGNKTAALAAMRELEAAGLGKLESTESRNLKCMLIVDCFCMSHTLLTTPALLGVYLHQGASVTRKYG